MGCRLPHTPLTCVGEERFELSYRDVLSAAALPVGLTRPCAARDLNPVPWIKSPLHSRTCSRRRSRECLVPGTARLRLRLSRRCDQATPGEHGCGAFATALLRRLDVSRLPVPVPHRVSRGGSRTAVPVERKTGIEPARSAWRAEALPLSYIRMIVRTIPGVGPGTPRGAANLQPLLLPVHDPGGPDDVDRHHRDA